VRKYVVKDMTKELEEKMQRKIVRDDWLLDYNDLARALNLSKMTVYRMVKRGDLPKPIQLSPQTVRWRADDIKSWIKNHTYESEV
jgi:prophage regulatory protein